MDSLSHFALSLIGGLAMGLHRKHKFTYLLGISFLSVLIDVDHFIYLYGLASEVRIFHNIYFAVLLPFTLFVLSTYLERNTESIRYQTFFLLMTLMLSGHLIADMVQGPVKIFYPLSEFSIMMPAFEISVTENNWGIVLPAGLGLASYAILIMAGAMVHDTIYHKKHLALSTKDALKYSIRDYF